MTHDLSYLPDSLQNCARPPFLESRSQLLRKRASRKTDSQPWMARLNNQENGLKTYSGLLLIIYVAIPAFMYVFLFSDAKFLKLSLLSCLALAAMWLGSLASLFDSRFKTRAVRLKLNSDLFHALTWIILLVFLLVTFITAPSIPLISELQGATADAIGQERGDFFKIGIDAEIALLYISKILVSAVTSCSIVSLHTEIVAILTSL